MLGEIGNIHGLKNKTAVNNAHDSRWLHSLPPLHT